MVLIPLNFVLCFNFTGCLAILRIKNVKSKSSMQNTAQTIYSSVKVKCHLQDIC